MSRKQKCIMTKRVLLLLDRKVWKRIQNYPTNLKNISSNSKKIKKIKADIKVGVEIAQNLNSEEDDSDDNIGQCLEISVNWSENLAEQVECLIDINKIQSPKSPAKISLKSTPEKTNKTNEVPKSFAKENAKLDLTLNGKIITNTAYKLRHGCMDKKKEKSIVKTKPPLAKLENEKDEFQNSLNKELDFDKPGLQMN